MDIDIIESTFNELMSELGKIKDLNETAESYKQRTRILSEQLEHFLSTAIEERSAILKDTKEIIALSNENEQKNTSSLTELRSSLCQTLNEYQHSQEKDQRIIIEHLDSLISQVVLLKKELMEQMDSSLQETQSRMKDDYHTVLDKIMELDLYYKTRFEQNGNGMRSIQKTSNIHTGLMIVILIILVLMIILK